jgi:hypothetical protein
MKKLGVVWKKMKVVLEKNLYNIGTLLKEAKENIIKSYIVHH